MKRATGKSRAARTKTMNASPEFVDLIVMLARAKNQTVREYCDAHVIPKLAAERRAYLAAELKKAGA